MKHVVVALLLSLAPSLSLASDAGEPSDSAPPESAPHGSAPHESATHDSAPDEGAPDESAPDGSLDVVAPSPGPASAAVVHEPASLQELRQRKVVQTFGGRFMGVLGCVVLIGLALLLSSDRRRIDWKLVGIGISLQLAFALIVLKTELGRRLFDVTNDAVKKLLSFSKDGARFLFGNLVDMAVPVTGADGAATSMMAQTGALFAFGVLPTILFFSMGSAILYHLGVLQKVVQGLAWVMRRAMGTSGAESLAAAANIFVGQTEAPLLVRPFLPKMTRSELMALMTGGFATVAGGVMAAYVGMLEGAFPDIAGHLVAASVMSAPASLVMAKIMVPETEVPETRDGAHISVETTDANVIDAAARGTSEGLQLALNVGAMLIAFTALIPLVNWLLQLPGLGFELAGMEAARDLFQALTLERILGWIFAPLAFLLGVPWDDAAVVGGMLGTKTVINEFVAYLQLSGALANGQLLHGKSVIITTYALCGFSNFASIGIQLGGLTVIAPGRRKDLAELGLRAMVGASLACFMTAAVAGMLL